MARVYELTDRTFWASRGTARAQPKRKTLEEIQAKVKERYPEAVLCAYSDSQALFKDSCGHIISSKLFDFESAIGTSVSKARSLYGMCDVHLLPFLEVFPNTGGRKLSKAELAMIAEQEKSRTQEGCK